MRKDKAEYKKRKEINRSKRFGEARRLFKENFEFGLDFPQDGREKVDLGRRICGGVSSAGVE